jgi:beta-N-acetylhexosaminidase
MKFTSDQRLATMSVEQKVGQVMMVGFDGVELSVELREMITRFHLGGVVEFTRNVASPRQLAQLNADLQHTARESGHPGLFVSIDQEGGRVTRLQAQAGFTEFPSAMEVGASKDAPLAARTVARAMAGEMRAVGINMDLAPVLDVNNNAANPVIGSRSYGADPQQVAACGVAFLETLQAEGIMAVGKHFPGHGDTTVDSHLALPVVAYDRARLEAVEFVPFRAAIRAGVAGIMSAHIAFPAIDPTGVAATLSPQVMAHLLRDEFGFGGIRMTDSLEMGALATSGYPAPLAAATALQAGADMLLFNRDHDLHRQAYALVIDWVGRGGIPMARLDEAVRRVLMTKERFGVL